MSDWKFDAPTGTWRSEPISKVLLDKAIEVSGIDLLWAARLVGRHPTVRFPEFGRAIEKPETVDALVPSLAECIRRVRFWVVPPHLRRNDASGYVCSCGFKAPLPSEFGRVSPLRDHQVLYPEHTATFVPRPGDTFAWYGIAAEAPDGVEPLREMSPIPVLPTEAA